MTPEPIPVARANLLLAVSTGLAFVLQMVAAYAFAPPAMRFRPLAIGPAVVVAYLVLNRLVLKRPARPPLVQPGSPVTLLFAALLPLIPIACAGASALWPGHDFSLATIVAGVLFGLTLESAVDARNP